MTLRYVLNGRLTFEVLSVVQGNRRVETLRANGIPVEIL